MSDAPPDYGREKILPEAKCEPGDDLDREVYGVFGIPLDACGLDEVEGQVRSAIDRNAPLLLSTPNLNFLFLARRDPEFRRSLEESDLCAVDGWPVLLLARALGFPVRHTAAGSDLWEQMRSRTERPLDVFLFGGPDGVAERACLNVNAHSAGLRCVGYHSPGFGDVDALSDPGVLADINACGAQLLSVSLGAQKGQRWLLRNHARLTVPVRAHFGAVVNFEAGAVKRAPKYLRSLGLEWVWRIKEERQLWSRYLSDGLCLLRFVTTNFVSTIALSGVMHRGSDASVEIEVLDEPGRSLVKLSGAATRATIAPILASFRRALAHGRDVEIDIERVHDIDSRFIGAVLMLRKQAGPCRSVALVRPTRLVRAWLSMSCFAHLLS